MSYRCHKEHIDDLSKFAQKDICTQNVAGPEEDKIHLQIKATKFP